MSFLTKIADFISKPYIPWFFISQVNKISPSLARFLAYGNSNINTGDYWDDQWNQRDFVERDDHYQKLTEYVIKMIPANSSLLDVGCGPGGLLMAAKDNKCCTCTGIDISQIAIKEIINKGFIGYVAELPDLPVDIEGLKFDVITSMELLEHLTKPEKTIEKLSNLICPEGIFIVSVPNDSMGPHEMDEHMHQFTIESLSKLVGQYFNSVTANVIEIKSLEYLIVAGKGKI